MSDPPWYDDEHRQWLARRAERHRRRERIWRRAIFITSAIEAGLIIAVLIGWIH